MEPEVCCCTPSVSSVFEALFVDMQIRLWCFCWPSQGALGATQTYLTMHIKSFTNIFLKLSTTALSVSLKRSPLNHLTWPAVDLLFNHFSSFNEGSVVCVLCVCVQAGCMGRCASAVCAYAGQMWTVWLGSGDHRELNCNPETPRCSPDAHSIIHPHPHETARTHTPTRRELSSLNLVTCNKFPPSHLHHHNTRGHHSTQNQDIKSKS